MKFLKSLVALAALLSIVCCKRNDGKLSDDPKDRIDITAAQIDAFLDAHPDFKPFRAQYDELYKKHDYHFVWYDKDGRVDFAEVLHNRTNQIADDGIVAQTPYKSQIDALFDDDKKASADNELLISGLYFHYAKTVFVGVDPKKSKATGWYLPRDKMDYVAYLDTLLKEPDKIAEPSEENVGQYYNLRKALQRYRSVKDKGGWAKIDFPSDSKMLKPGDQNPAILQTKKRLAATGEFDGTINDSYDSDLADAVLAYRKRNNILGENLTPMLVDHLNVPVEQRIKTIVVNMERCRWIQPEIAESPELIAVNIPAYHMIYRRDGKTILESNVVVGKEANKTVVFSGKISYLVFSPYWNIPKSILEKEVKPGIAQDPDYLAKHNMEWNESNVRQLPGQDNSLGLVKFMFPNSNNIYLHDTPAKSLFGKDDRAQSHGCVRVEKARELAIKILDGDPKWNAKKIDEAMHAGTESQYTLKRKIPVYIAYFTAWASENGIAAFYPDVYDRDGKLASLLYAQK